MKKRVSMNNSVLNSDSGSTSTSARACQHYKKKNTAAIYDGPGKLTSLALASRQHYKGTNKSTSRIHAEGLLYRSKARRVKNCCGTTAVRGKSFSF